MSHVIGTAGHIDHGKSSLIRALTGIDPDRLEEEKRRGMTIDLGFAHFELPSSRRVAVVDVPGHARFIRNMLAGVHGLDAVILVVAADEGVMPQTREHLDIIDLLEVERGVVALSKADLVESDWLQLVQAEVEETLSRTALRGARTVPVSSVTGTGLEELRTELDRLLETTGRRPDRGRPRLPIDRVFTMRGFGTVVTGTLVDGSIKVGSELESQPGGRRVRIRGLQQHNQAVEVALPGSRVAANLAGVERHELARGDVLAQAGTLRSTRRVDGQVRVLQDAPRSLRNNAQVTYHSGTVEVAGRVVMLGGEEIPAGESGWVQVYLSRPVAAAVEDRFVLRLPSPSTTIAGGRLLDVNPARHARHDQRVVGSLERRSTGEVLKEELRKYARGVTVEGLLAATLAERAEVDQLAAVRVGGWLFSPEAWVELSAQTGRVLAAYHAAHPLRPGMSREELKGRLRLQPAALAPVLEELARGGTVVDRGGEVALPEHRVDTGGAGPAGRLLEMLDRDPLSPPSLAEAMRESGAGLELVKALDQEGRMVRVSEDFAFGAAGYAAAVDLVRQIASADGSVTVAGLRDRMGTSRRRVLALFEYLDSHRVTRRVGDERVLR